MQPIQDATAAMQLPPSWLDPAIIIALLAVIVSAMTTIIMATGINIARLQLRTLVLQHSENTEIKKNTRTAEVCDRFPHLSTRHLTLSLRYEDREPNVDPISIHEIRDVIDTSSEGKSNPEFARELLLEIHQLLNYFDGLARGIRLGLYSERVVSDAFRGQMTKAALLLEPYVHERRGNPANPVTWSDFYDLVKKWRSEDVSNK
ncbi:MAG: hypothetical protein Phyf2KO_00770 [Phycisphaerales bacterium]